MPMLEFQKKKKRDAPLTVRLTKDSINKLKRIAEKYSVSQADVIEQLIEKGYEEAAGVKSKKCRLNLNLSHFFKSPIRVSGKI